jgi:hypothetical protein
MKRIADKRAAYLVGGDLDKPEALDACSRSMALASVPTHPPGFIIIALPHRRQTVVAISEWREACEPTASEPSVSGQEDSLTLERRLVASHHSELLPIVRPPSSGK